MPRSCSWPVRPPSRCLARPHSMRMIGAVTAGFLCITGNLLVLHWPGTSVMQTIASLMHVAIPYMRASCFTCALRVRTSPAESRSLAVLCSGHQPADGAAAGYPAADRREQAHPRAGLPAAAHHGQQSRGGGGRREQGQDRQGGARVQAAPVDPVPRHPAGARLTLLLPCIILVS